MWALNLDPEQPFVYSIFGAQYDGDEPDEVKRARIDAFDKLIAPSAKYIDNVIQENSLRGTKTRTWLAYWTSPSSYKEWWEHSDTVEFWASLPPDAGMWREVLTVPKRRIQMYPQDGEEPHGVAHVGTLTPYTGKIGYWGSYRDRLEEATSTNRLASPLSSPPEAQEATGATRPGRVRMTTFPDNLCFVVVGEDHSSITTEEKDHWFENFDGPVTKWITDLVDAGPPGGILDARLCYFPESGKFRDLSPDALNYNRKVQLFYFLDFSYMERIAWGNKGHVALRNHFMQSYSPAGPMGQIAQFLMWVETSVVKSNEIECEYVGCLEGTGLMAYDNHPAFKGNDDVPASH